MSTRLDPSNDRLAKPDPGDDRAMPRLYSPPLAPALATAVTAAEDDLCMGRDLPAGARPVAFIDRGPWQCAWPIEPVGTPGHAHMPCCGAPADEGSSYCASHAARARRETPAQPVRPPYEASVIRRFSA